MALRLLRLVTLTFAALVTGLAFAHVLELPPKMGYDPGRYFETQRTLYAYYAYVGGPLEVLAVLGAALLAFLLRGRGWVFGWTLAGAILLAAGLAEWAVVVQSANVEMARWTAERIPGDWSAVRGRWEYGHVGHFLLFGAGLVVLLWSVVGDRESHAGR